MEECRNFECVFCDVQDKGPCPFCADHTSVKARIEQKHNKREVGEVFTFENVKLKVEISDSCNGCYFENCDINMCKENQKICGMCGAIHRNDENNVIFKKV